MPRDIIQNYLVSEAAKTKLSRSFSFTNTFKSLLLSLLSWALCHILSQRRFTVPAFVSRFAKVSSMSCVWAKINLNTKEIMDENRVYYLQRGFRHARYCFCTLLLSDFHRGRLVPNEKNKKRHPVFDEKERLLIVVSGWMFYCANRG